MKQIITELAGSVGGFRFLEKDYNRTVELLTMARNYFQLHGHLDKSRLPMGERLHYTLAMSTITTQLSSVMAWLMLWKAVEQGEVTLEKAGMENFRLSEATSSLHERPEIQMVIPKPVQMLLAQSEQLYARIKRLDDRIQGKLDLLEVPELVH
jgi:hypothetical protein